jgi:hypothetical protein
MRRFLMALTAVCLAVVVAAPALADAQPSARDIQTAVDSYLATSDQDVNLVGGPGSAGYDQGFWIKGGDFSLKINLTLQARFEYAKYDAAFAGRPQSTLSGFSLPRATLKFSGTAPCSVSYYMELEFGHYGRDVVTAAVGPGGFVNNALGPYQQSLNFDNTREAWVQWSMSDLFNFRMGQIKTANTRQLMTAPEMQQFVDISLASAFIGHTMPGYTDRNRDHGFAIHGAFGCDNEWSYLITVTNGDGGDSIRNVLDTRTSDGVAFSGRLNWAFLNPIGYQEGALRQSTCEWYGEIGGWGYYYADRFDAPHTTVADVIRFGGDLALGYSGFSFTGAFNYGMDEDAAGNDVVYTAILAQLGYHFPGTAWEVAGRWSTWDIDNAAPAFVLAAPGGSAPNALMTPVGNGAVSEFGFAINYYLNGHGNKLTLDVSIISGDDVGSVMLTDPYVGVRGGAIGANDVGILIRFQWQLAL